MYESSKGKSFNCNTCMLRYCRYACIYVKVYGLLEEKKVTVVYVMRLIRNHDLAGVQHYHVCHSLTAGRYININSDTT